MAPHDLLCKWCSTFVGKGKKFCSIFCESRHTRSKRRKLAFKRPVYSSGPRDEKEYVSPRSNKTAPARKESFLEDVITAIENDKPSPERDKHRPNGDTSSISIDNKSPSSSARLNQSTGSQHGDSLSITVPKLDLSSPKEKKNKGKDDANARERERKAEKDMDHVDHGNEKATGGKLSAINKNDRSKTQTLLVHNQDSKLPVRNKALIHHRTTELKTTDASRKSKLRDDSINIDDEGNHFIQINDVGVKAQRQRSKTVVDMEKKIRSSGYGNPVNPRLRPMVLKPRSATVSSSSSKQKREASAKSTKSATLDIHSLKKEDTRPTVGGQMKGNWELIPTTITEETSKQVDVNGNSSLENEKPTPESTPRKSTRSNESSRELAKIHEILREESTHSDLLSQTELQLRLSSIKRKVEVRRRGRDSRSSYGSDLDLSFPDSTTDLTVDKEGLHYSARESGDEVGYCHFCCRKLYIPGSEFCDRGCENRKRQLRWKSAHIGNENIPHNAMGFNSHRSSVDNPQRIPWKSDNTDLPKIRRNRYVWDTQERKPEEFSNFTNYKPSWAMVHQ